MNKTIHYCWFGGKPLPDSAVKCINSWKKFLPDFEIKRWDETNYDVNKCPYMKEAYEAKKYGFVPDYARFDILYEHGGLYFDTDVEVIKPLDDILQRGPFMGLEEGTVEDLIKLSKCKNVEKFTSYVACGLGLYATPKMKIYKELMNSYNNLHFLNNNKLNLLPSPVINTSFLLKKKISLINNLAYCEGVYIYPIDYFNPLGKERALGDLNITNNTRTIHHYDASWISDKEKKWLLKMKQKKIKIGSEKFKIYNRSVLTKIRRSLYVNGIFGFLKNSSKE